MGNILGYRTLMRGFLLIVTQALTGVFCGNMLDDIGGRAWPTSHGWQDCLAFSREFDCAAGATSGDCTTLPNGAILYPTEFSKWSAERPPVAMHGFSHAKFVYQIGTCVLYTLLNSQDSASFSKDAALALLSQYVGDNGQRNIMDGCIRDPILSSGQYLCFGYWDNGSEEPNNNSPLFSITSKQSWVSHGGVGDERKLRKLLVNNPTTRYIPMLSPAGHFVVRTSNVGSIMTAVISRTAYMLVAQTPTAQIVPSVSNSYSSSTRGLIDQLLPRGYPNVLFGAAAAVAATIYTDNYELVMTITPNMLQLRDASPAYNALLASPIIQQRIVSVAMSFLVYASDPVRYVTEAENGVENRPSITASRNLVTAFVISVRATLDNSVIYRGGGTSLIESYYRASETGLLEVARITTEIRRR